MEYEILYWHWIVFGVALMLSEIMLTTFFILWFGAAAIVIGLLMLAFPEIPLEMQILLWTILSSSAAWAWFKYIKPLSIDKTKAGLSRESIVDEVGQIISVPNGEKRGKLRFPAPVLGSDEWEIISSDELTIGDRARVKDVSGNTLVVTKA
mgnify:CR=1 FL=1